MTDEEERFDWYDKEETESTTCLACEAKKVFPLDVQTEVGNDTDGYYTIQIYVCVACGTLSSRAEIINFDLDGPDELPF